MKLTTKDVKVVENPEFRMMNNRVGLFNSSFQDFKKLGLPKAQLILTDIPYNLSTNMYGSNPSWYLGGDRTNGESELAGETAFVTDENFKPAEFMHFAAQMLKPEPKEKSGRTSSNAPCMIVFCEFMQQFYLIELAKRYGFNHYINLVFRKNYSAQVLKANMKIVGNCEYGLVLYRNKLPKFNNNGQMVFNCMDWSRDLGMPKIAPTQKPIPLLKRLIELFTDVDDVVIDPCVDADTEYFNGKEWVKISKYIEGDKVLIYDMQSGECRLEIPQRYLKQPYNKPFIHYESYSLDIMATPNHDIVNYDTVGKIRKTPFSKVWEDNQTKKLGFRGLVPLSFNMDFDNSEYNEHYLRLMVACQADGSIVYNHRNGKPLKTNRYRIRVIKERKAIRLRNLLNDAQIEYTERKEKKLYKGETQYYYLFSFKSPYGCKIFDWKYLYAQQNYKEIILDELKYWDGNIGKNGNIRYTTIIKQNADFVQMLAHSCNKSARISVDNRNSTPCYTVSFSKWNKAKLSQSYNFGKGLKNNMNLVEVNDKYCYCFSVSTGAFVVRRNGKIHITGNCAGSGSTIVAAASLGRKAYGLEISKRFYVDACDALKNNIHQDLFNESIEEKKRREYTQQKLNLQ